MQLFSWIQHNFHLCIAWMVEMEKGFDQGLLEKEKGKRTHVTKIQSKACVIIQTVGILEIKTYSDYR